MNPDKLDWMLATLHVAHVENGEKSVVEVLASHAAAQDRPKVMLVVREEAYRRAEQTVPFGERKV